MPLSAALRRSGAACLLGAAALVPFALSSTDAGAATSACVGQAQQPSYDASSKYAEGVGYMLCDGSFTLQLRTSSGTVLTSFSGSALGGSELYTDLVSCPTGTVIYSYLSSHGSAGGVKWAGTSRSASITCT
ncbi:MAG TPA: hypothetical protein VFU36_04410 [Jatrophihabitans sp.]|nr:hypothetical protein [Jatrophihabitans sp.]